MGMNNNRIKYSVHTAKKYHLFGGRGFELVISFIYQITSAHNDTDCWIIRIHKGISKTDRKKLYLHERRDVYL